MLMLMMICDKISLLPLTFFCKCDKWSDHINFEMCTTMAMEMIDHGLCYVILYPSLFRVIFHFEASLFFAVQNVFLIGAENIFHRQENAVNCFRCSNLGAWIFDATFITLKHNKSATQQKILSSASNCNTNWHCHMKNATSKEDHLCKRPFIWNVFAVHILHDVI